MAPQRQVNSMFFYVLIFLMLPLKITFALKITYVVNQFTNSRYMRALWEHRQRDRQKNNRLKSQNNNSARALHFLDISLPSLHDLEVKFLDGSFHGGRQRRTANFPFSF